MLRNKFCAKRVISFDSEENLETKATTRKHTTQLRNVQPIEKTTTYKNSGFYTTVQLNVPLSYRKYAAVAPRTAHLTLNLVSAPCYLYK